MNENENINNSEKPGADDTVLNRYDKYTNEADTSEYTTGYQSVYDSSVNSTEAAGTPVNSTETAGTPVSSTETSAGTPVNTTEPAAPVCQAVQDASAGISDNVSAPSADTVQDTTAQASASADFTSGTDSSLQQPDMYSSDIQQADGNTGVSETDYYSRYNTSYDGYSTNALPDGSMIYVNPDGNAPESGNTASKKERSGAAKFFIGLGCAAAFGLVAAGIFIGSLFLYNKYAADKTEGTPNSTETRNEVTVSTADNTATDNSSLNLEPAADGSEQVGTTNIINTINMTSTDISDVVEKCMPSIVSIRVKGNQTTIWGVYETEGAGSGIIIEQNDSELLIATNNHVVESTTEINIDFCDGTTAPATIKGLDSVADLGVVSVKLEDLSGDTLKNIKIAEIGNSDEIKVGQMAIAIGNSLGYGQSVTVGYISAKDREVTIDQQKMQLLQTDAAINPGNSGGALLNIKGEVIGINSAKYSDASVEGMGFAIPITRAQNILADLATREVIAKEDQGYLGIYYSVVTSETAKSYNWPLGIYIKELVKDGAAEKAGLKAGDIITAVDGVEITNDTQLTGKLAATRYGTKITVTAKRLIEGEFEEMTFEVTLGQRPAEEVTPTPEESKDGKSSDGRTPENGKGEENQDGSDKKNGSNGYDDYYDYYDNSDDFFDDFFGGDPFDFFFGY